MCLATYLDACLGMCLVRHVFGHVFGHVFRHVFGHVFRHENLVSSDGAVAWPRDHTVRDVVPVQ